MTRGRGDRAAILCGLGATLPTTVVSNEQLCARLDTTDEWIRTRTGITHRRVAEPGVSTEDLAVAAGAAALQSADECRVQAVVLASTTIGRCCPAAPVVAARLGLTGIAAHDVGAGCTGFLYALATGVGFLAAGIADAVLVIGADRLSTLPDPDDRSTVPLFGDAAGAVVLRRGARSDHGAIGPLVLGSDGANHALLTAAQPGTLEMDGPGVFRQAIARMPAAAAQAAQAAGCQLTDIDRLAPHQANSRITDVVADRLGIPDERRLGNIQHVGDTGAASIPLLLAQASGDRRITPGHHVLLTAFGAGLTWGATTLTWPVLDPITSVHPLGNPKETP